MTTPSGPPEEPPQPSPAPAAGTPPAPTTPPPQAPATPVISWDAPKEEVGPAPGVRFASHGPRLVAYIIDSLIIGVVYVVIFTIGAALLLAGARTGGFDESGIPTGGIPTGVTAAAWGLFALFFVVTLILALAYFPFFWARSGQTPGMRPFGLYVVRDDDGGKISGGQAILRLIGMWVAAIPFYLGFIWIFIDARRRGWQDLIAGTIVIERIAPR